jgi:exodeoxyribonuclease X
MTFGSDRPTRFRILDLETTGLCPDDAVVEIGAVDLVGDQAIIIGSDLVRPPIPIPPEASAIHHITDDDVRPCRTLDEHPPFYLDQTGNTDVNVFAFHNLRFEAQWLGESLRGRPVIAERLCIQGSSSPDSGSEKLTTPFAPAFVLVTAS